MSSFSKNIVPRREHRERSQPDRRVARHGLLEKKKDYKLRAKDASRKKRRVRLLKEKAAFRNPDEFYHAMSSGGTKAGVVKKVKDANAVREGEHHTADGAVRRLVETQDRGYVRMKIARERGEVAKAREGLHFMDVGLGAGKHTVFVASDEEDDGGLEDFDREKYFVKERARAKSFVAGKEEDGVEEGIVPRASGKDAVRMRSRAGKKGYAELDQRMERVRRLDMAMEDLALRQKLLGKGRRRKVSAGDPKTGVLPVFKWRRVRKR